jgi:chromosome segregation ATPase
MIDESTTRQHELDRRVAALEDEVEGEKRVSRHILQETRQNSGDLAAIKAQLMHLAGDMVVVNATLNNHGTRLNVLTQDVREIRTAMGEVRAELAQTRTEMGEMRVEMDRRFDAVERSMALILAAVAPHAP